MSIKEGEGLGWGAATCFLNRLLCLRVNPTPNPSPAMGTAEKVLFLSKVASEISIFDYAPR